MLAESFVDPSEMLSAQRLLRDRLLGTPATSESRAMRELAAEMLLYLDQPDSCWKTCIDWVLNCTSADRIDAGFASPARARYSPSFERIKAHAQMPSILGMEFDSPDGSIVRPRRSTTSYARCG